MAGFTAQQKLGSNAASFRFAPIPAVWMPMIDQLWSLSPRRKGVFFISAAEMAGVALGGGKASDCSTIENFGKA
jgi:hypothetical protein